MLRKQIYISDHFEKAVEIKSVISTQRTATAAKPSTKAPCADELVTLEFQLQGNYFPFSTYTYHHTVFKDAEKDGAERCIG